HQSRPGDWKTVLTDALPYLVDPSTGGPLQGVNPKDWAWVASAATNLHDKNLILQWKLDTQRLKIIEFGVSGEEDELINKSWVKFNEGVVKALQGDPDCL